jgi:hypothetical protein
MEKIEINGELDRMWIISLMAEGFDTYEIVKNYNLSEELILDSTDLLDKEVLIQGLNFSEDFLDKAINCEYFSKEDLNNLSMTTYSNLSKNFLQKYKEELNWAKLLLYVSTQTDSFGEYVEIIEENNLWELISANNLPIDFIRDYKEKLNWDFLSVIKEFTDEEKLEFADYIVETKRETPDDDLNEFKSIIPNFREELSVDDISELIEKFQVRYY